MTLAVAVYVPEGIVMATDSRAMISVEEKTPTGESFRFDTPCSDAVMKTFLLEAQGIGISVFGQTMLGGLPVGGHLKKFIEEEVTTADDIETIPRKLVNYFRRAFPDVNVGFHVCGYKKERRISIPHVYYCHVGRNIIERRNVRPDGSIAYGATWSGEIDVLASIVNPVITREESGVERIVRSPPPIIWDGMTLQDAIDFAVYTIRTTADTMRFQARLKTVGGPIDVLIIVPEGAKWIQRKELRS